MCRSCCSTDVLRGQSLVLRTEQRSSADPYLPNQPFLLQPDDVCWLSEDQPRSGRVELKLLRPFKERSRSRGGGCKTATMEVGALHVLTSNGLFMLGKIEQDRTRRINDKRGEIQPVFSSLSVGIGTPLMWKCRSELAKP